MPEILQRFVRGRGWDSRIIEAFYPPFSHSEICQNGHTFGAMLDGGVRWRDLSDPCYKNCEFFYVRVPCTSEEEKVFWDFLLAQDGKPYDIKAILSFIPGIRWFVRDRNWRDDKAWFCDELDIAAYEKAGILSAPEDMVIISFAPRDLAEMLRQAVYMRNRFWQWSL